MTVGIYISVGRLSDDGLTITGTEDLIGFDAPSDWAVLKKNTFEFKNCKFWWRLFYRMA